MIHSRLLTTCSEYRKKFLPNPKRPSTTTTPPKSSVAGTNPRDSEEGCADEDAEVDGPSDLFELDRPLIAQLCGHDPRTVVEAARLLAPHCDGIDLNCGCPQGIARRGRYGAFLLEDPDTLLSVVSRLVEELSVPVSVKVRLLPGSTREESLRNSIELYRRLVDAGIAMLTVHGRTRHNKGHLTGSADWDAVRRVVQEFGDAIPIVANGGIGSRSDAVSCWERTGADGIMSSEAILENPALFAVEDRPGLLPPPPPPGRTRLAREYLRLAARHPSDAGGQGSGLKCARMHVHRILHADLQEREDLRQRVSDAPSLDELEAVVDRLEALHRDAGHDPATEEPSWYLRHRQVGYENGRMVNLSEQKRAHESTVASSMDLDDDAADCFASLFDDEGIDEQ
jgi:tRNA-dihydrouridine synthase 1